MNGIGGSGYGFGRGESGGAARFFGRGESVRAALGFREVSGETQNSHPRGLYRKFCLGEKARVLSLSE